MSMNKEWTPNIVAFCCNWCSYAGADLAGSGRMNYPANVKIIRIPCSCRLNPIFVLRAFQRGADGVILCGCNENGGFWELMRRGEASASVSDQVQRLIYENCGADAAAEFGVEDKEVVCVKVNTNGRSLIFGDVVVRVNDSYALAMHIDTDESNAAGMVPGVMGEIVK